MDIRKQLLFENGVRNMKAIAVYVQEHPKSFKSLLEILLSKDEILAGRAAWCVSLIGNADPDFLQPHLFGIIQSLKLHSHPAVIRNLLKALSRLDILEALRADIFELCLNIISDSKKPGAIRCNAMSVAASIVKNQPGLKNELILVISQKPDSHTPAYNARAKKVLIEIDHYSD